MLSGNHVMGLEEVAPVPSPLLFPLLLPLPPGKNRLKQKLNNVQQNPLQWLMHPGLDFQIPSPTLQNIAPPSLIDM